MALEITNAEHAPSIAPEQGAHLLTDALEQFVARHYDRANHIIDYGALQASPATQTLVSVADRLPGMNPADLESTSARVAFWLNVWNVLLLQVVTRKQPATSIRSIDQLFTRPAYRIGAHDFTLDDIEHGVLRSNAHRGLGRGALFGRRDPRLSLVLNRVQPLVHFGFYTACESAPRLQSFTAETVHDQLAAAATGLLDRTVAVTEHTLWVPRTFYWYQQDFGGARGAVGFIADYLPEGPRREQIRSDPGRFRFEYLDYDWSLNDRFSVRAPG